MVFGERLGVNAVTAADACSDAAFNQLLLLLQPIDITRGNTLKPRLPQKLTVIVNTPQIH
jgi:hypothetical protein